MILDIDQSLSCHQKYSVNERTIGDIPAVLGECQNRLLKLFSVLGLDTSPFNILKEERL